MNAARGAPARVVRCALLLLSCGQFSAAWAETVPAKGRVDARIRTAEYRADEVYKLTGSVGYMIELIFEEGEVFAGKAGGDLEAVVIDGYRHQVHVKPKAPVVATNLVIYTDRRAYRFDYSASDETSAGFREAIYAVRFRYPSEPAAPAPGKPSGESVAETLARAPTERARNFNYWFCGNPALKPMAAVDDGIHTRLTFPARAELPAIFVRNGDGSASLLNFHVENGDVVIHRIAERLILRRGRVTGCVVNKGFAGSGERLDSGTLSPAVQRDTKGPRL